MISVYWTVVHVRCMSEMIHCVYREWCIKTVWNGPTVYCIWTLCIISGLVWCLSVQPQAWYTRHVYSLVNISCFLLIRLIEARLQYLCTEATPCVCKSKTFSWLLCWHFHHHPISLFFTKWESPEQEMAKWNRSNRGRDRISH